MPSISVTQLYNFKHTKVTFSEVAQAKTTDYNFAGVVLMPDNRSKARCSNCGEIGSRVHQTRSRILRDLPLGTFRKPWISYSYRMVDCDNCNEIHVESSDVADVGGPRITQRFARYVQELCCLMSVKKVADHCQLDWKTVKTIDMQGLQKEFKETDYSNLRILAVDEIAYAKHHKYLTIVIDYETGRVVWTGEGHSKETLDQFFAAMPSEVKDNIEAVAMDMWEPFTQAVMANCPNAAIVYDFFHIVANYNKVIDQVRRQEYQKASEEDSRIIKGSRWMLLKNPENLTDKEKPHLEELLTANESLSKVYILKDSLKEIWACTDRVSMETALDGWCSLAMEAELTSLNRYVKMLQNHKDGILNHAEFPIHTSKLEGINNKIKVLKRESYGFHDQEYFSLKIKQRCPGTA